MPRFSYPSNLPYAKYTVLATTHACIRNERIVDGDIKDGEDRNGNQEAGKKKRDLRIEDSSLDSGSVLA